MANRFDTPYGQRYVSTYVPLPLEQIGNIAKSYSDRYKLGQALPQQIDMLGQAIKAAPVDIDNKNQLISEYKKAINDITSTARPEDYAKPEYQNKINNLVFQFKNDPRLNTIMSNKEAFDKVYQPYLSSKDAKKDLVLTNIISKDHSSGYRQMKPGEALAPLDYITHEDAIKGAKTIMDDIKIDGTPLSSISTWKRDGNYFIDQDGHRKEITKDKVYNLAKANVGNYADNTEGRFRFKSVLNQLGLDPHMSYSDFKYNPTISDKVKKAVDEELANDLFNYGSKQIFKDTDISYSLHNNELALHKGKKKIDEEPVANYLPSFEGNIDSAPMNNKQALASLGMNVTSVNDDGTINYNWTSLDPKDVKKQIDWVEKEHREGRMSTEEYAQWARNIQDHMVPKMNSNQKIANNYYSDLLRSAKNVGLDISSYTDKNSHIDYDRLKGDMINFAKSLNTQASSIQGFQANFADDLSKFYFGKSNDKGEFQNSPFFQKLQIYEHNNPNSKDKLQSDEVLPELAQNGKFIGLDFNDSNLGAMSFTATKGKGEKEPKLYTAVTPDKVLKTLMQPVHQFTQDFKQAQLGKQSKEELNNNKNIALSNVSNLKQMVASSNDPNKARKIAKFDTLLSGISSQSKGLVVGTNNDGNKIFITQPIVENGQPVDKVIVIDVKTGDVSEQPYSLGQIQNEESTNIQNKLAPAYNQSAQGYENKDIRYK